MTGIPLSALGLPVRDRSYERARSARAVQDWLAYLELGGTAGRTVDQYERDLSRMCLAFPDKTIAEITDGDLLHVIRSFPAASRRVRSAAYRSFFKYCRQHRLVDDNPMELVPTQKEKPPKVIDVFTDAEIEALLGLELRDRVRLRILFDAGLRKAEARNLRMLDCQLGRARLIVHQGKGSRDRVIPMPDVLVQELAAFQILDGVNPTDYVWHKTFGNAVSAKIVRNDGPCGPGTFHNWWVACLRDAGVRYRNPHVARHTFATRWRQRGLDLDEIQMLLGHASITTTALIYIHTGVDDVARHMALLTEAVE